tara:strand:- start:7815 stop:8270 length:456 start_codon:yes stop_codon:yes gene_type:complete
MFITSATPRKRRVQHDVPPPPYHPTLAETLGALEGYSVMRPDIESVYDWIREPDNADTFTANDFVIWANNRPTGEVLSAKFEIKSQADLIENQAALISELVGALEGAQKALAMMVDDDAIKSTTVAIAYANCRASELECRKAITKAKGSEQ